jgi:putative resolvase
MKLSEYARKVGVTYKTAWLWYKAGKLKGYRMDSGTIIIEADEQATVSEKVVVYARVSSGENRENLARQAERLVGYCAAKGYQVHQVVKEVGSGVNDSRPKFLALLGDPTVTRLVVEHKERATRFGFRYLETLLAQQQRVIEVVNLGEAGHEDLLNDLVAIVYSFCARLYGQRRAKRTTERITAALQREEANAVG